MISCKPALFICVAVLIVQQAAYAQNSNQSRISSASLQENSRKLRLLPDNRSDRQAILELALIGRVNLNSSVSRRLRKLDKLVLANLEPATSVIDGRTIKRKNAEIEKDLIKRTTNNQLIEAAEAYKLIKRAEANIKLKRYGKALEVYDLILKAFPTDTSSLLGRAECLYQRKKYKEVIAIYKEAKKLLGKDQNSMRYRPRILKNIADACYRKKDYFEAANIYNLVCNGGSSRLIKIDFTGQASRGKSLFTVGDYKKSAKAFRKALKHLEKLHGKPFTGTTSSEELEQRVEELEDRVNYGD